jgi:hypothetical protein
VPDLEIRYVQACATESLSERVVGSKGDVYDVLVYHDESLDSCTCPGFTYRRRCKHVTEMREKLCGWSELGGPEAQSPQQEMEAVCPRCGGETTVVRVGV